jgi:hypothetical protein
MQRDAQATHPAMLHQSPALWAKGMTGETVQAPTLSLTDRCTPGEVTFTDLRDGVTQRTLFLY